MSDRYHVHTSPTPPRFRRIGKYGSVDWREDCSRCSNCVKPRCCYDVYRHENAHNRDPLAPLQTLYECKACLSCVQGCTKGLLSISVNPEFLACGNDYWRPDILLTTWNQADAGAIPVSGAGYRGRFYGPGFDSIWTDMSEIVRPTRDGIHGREYISTAVDIGPKPLRLNFTPDGKLLGEPSRLLEIQVPAILDLLPWSIHTGSLTLSRASAAKELKSLAVIPAREGSQLDSKLWPYMIPLVGKDDLQSNVALLKAASLLQLQESAEISHTAAKIRAINPQAILSVRLPLAPQAADRILELAGTGIKVFHLCADQHGRERLDSGLPGRHIKDVLREVHGRLVNGRVRDEITLIISGGIALPEHMAKAIICGADLVAVDTPLLVALGCRVCRQPIHAGSNEDAPADRCPVEISSMDPEYAAQRMINLIGAWHSQLLEVLGAMGIREVRRLRGEVGRAIFMEDMEKEAFADLLRAPQKRVCA